jgi:hypothetical protein
MFHFNHNLFSSSFNLDIVSTVLRALFPTQTGGSLHRAFPVMDRARQQFILHIHRGFPLV